MSHYNFKNEYDVIVWSFSYLLHRFEDSNNLFAAQCIWWLANLVDLKNILSYYHQHKILHSEHQSQPSEQIGNLQSIQQTQIADYRDISPLSLDANKTSVTSNIPNVNSEESSEENHKDSSEDQFNKVENNAEKFLEESRRLRDLHQLRVKQTRNIIQTRKQRTAVDAIRRGASLMTNQSKAIEGFSSRQLNQLVKDN